MKIKMKPNLKGYITMHRGIQQLLKDRSLDLTSLGALVCFVLQADWDKKHPTYRCLRKNDYEIAQEWGLNPSTVFRRRKELIAKGFFRERQDGFTEVLVFMYFELEYNKTAARVPFVAPSQEKNADKQEGVDSSQEGIADMQDE